MQIAKLITVLGAMSFLTLLQYIALQHGFDGSLLFATIAAIAGLAGYNTRGGNTPTKPSSSS